jgi:hypothetical protein
MQKISMNQEAKGFTNDRATVIIRGHYQEFVPNQTASVFHAFDYTNPQSEAPFQFTMRLSPADRKLINIGDLEWGKTLLILSNEPPALGSQITTKLQGNAISNIISLTNEDGIEVARIRPRHACAIEFPFPVYAKPLFHTALLSVTAFPIIDQ